MQFAGGRRGGERRGARRTPSSSQWWVVAASTSAGGSCVSGTGKRSILAQKGSEMSMAALPENSASSRSWAPGSGLDAPPPMLPRAPLCPAGHACSAPWVSPAGDLRLPETHWLPPLTQGLLPSLGLPVPDHAGVLQALKRYQSALCLDTAVALDEQTRFALPAAASGRAQCLMTPHAHIGVVMQALISLIRLEGFPRSLLLQRAPECLGSSQTSIDLESRAHCAVPKSA